ncbi:hypothetical protein BHE74_00018375 [Ensete ventricosum]|nr:hypothetical protein BHE74_00018375 [Ensete ventricosum]
MPGISPYDRWLRDREHHFSQKDNQCRQTVSFTFAGARRLFDVENGVSWLTRGRRALNPSRAYGRARGSRLLLFLWACHVTPLAPKYVSIYIEDLPLYWQHDYDNVTTNVRCHGEHSVIKEGHKSFPSGHSSCK